MSSLRPDDLAAVGRLLDFVRGPGYVLDFSDRTFAEFFASELDIDIEDQRFCVDGGSKGRRLRAFLVSTDDGTALLALQALWDRRSSYLESAGVGDPVAGAAGRFKTLVARLGGGGSVDPPPPPREVPGMAETLLAELLRVRDMEAHARGYAFEAFLRRCFDSAGLDAREPFRNTGEQIDGSFQLGHETYLLEAKWTKAAIGNRDLHAFHGKLEAKAAWARGLFVSFGGFTPEGLVSFGTGKRVVCMSGRDIHEALRRGIPIRVVLDSKVRRAAETGQPFVAVEELLPDGSQPRLPG